MSKEFENYMYIQNKTLEIQNARIVEQNSKIEELVNSIKVDTEYKEAYNLLTDNAPIKPMVMRSNIQALFVNADNTSIINAEAFVDEWVAATSGNPIEHSVGDIKKENGQVYECKQAHTHRGEPNWNPSIYTAAWIIKHTKDVTNPKPFVQPTHAENSYMKGECVIWTDGKVYVSKVDNNDRSPSEYPDNWEVHEVI